MWPCFKQVASRRDIGLEEQLAHYESCTIYSHLGIACIDDAAAMEEPNRWLVGRWPRDHFTKGITYEHLIAFKPIEPQLPDYWPLVNKKKQTRTEIKKRCNQFSNLQQVFPDRFTAGSLSGVFIGYAKDNTLLYYDTYIQKTWNRYAALGIAQDQVPTFSIDDEWVVGQGRRASLKNSALDVNLPYEYGYKKVTNYLDVNTIYWDCNKETGRDLVYTVLQSLKRTYGGTRTINVLKEHDFYFMNKETFEKLMTTSDPRKEITSWLKDENSWLLRMEDMGFRLTYATPDLFGSSITTVSTCIEILVNKIFDNDDELNFAFTNIVKHFIGDVSIELFLPMFFVNPLTTSYFDMLKLRHEKPKDKRDLGKMDRLPRDTMDLIFQTQRRSASTLRLLLL